MSGCLTLNAAWVWLLLHFLRIACTVLHILYFSTEGHYDITKDCRCAFSCCARVTYILEARWCTDIFKVFILKSWPGGTWGNNLNVFIVFYWNKSFKLLISAKCTFSVLTPISIPSPSPWQTWKSPSGYSTHNHPVRQPAVTFRPSRMQRRWLRGEKCSIKQHLGRKTLTFHYFTNVFMLSSLKQ